MLSERSQTQKPGSSDEEGGSWPEGGRAVVSKISSKIKRRGWKVSRQLREGRMKLRRMS